MVGRLAQDVISLAFLLDTIIETPSSQLMKDAARKFRRAIQKGRSNLPEWFKDFPKGCCGDATAMLGSYLKENGFGSFLFISSEFFLTKEGVPQNPSHAWLNRGELIVDITASQFDDELEDVIVSDNSEWHKKWEQTVLREAEYNSCSNISESAYNKIAEIAKTL